MKGTVTDWSKLVPFSATGEDHSFNVMNQKHVEYFNDFSAGVYSVGDITLEDYTTFGGNKGLYWKTYRRGINSKPLCINCVFARTTIEGPGECPCRFKDSDFTAIMKPIQSTIIAPSTAARAAYVRLITIFDQPVFEWSNDEDNIVPGAPFFYSDSTLTNAHLPPITRSFNVSLRM